MTQLATLSLRTQKNNIFLILTFLRREIIAKLTLCVITEHQIIVRDHGFEKIIT